MITVLYSTDYELFLGANFVPEQRVLIDPTERLLSACEGLGVPVTLFADVASIWRHRELGREDFPRLAEAQMRDALRRGHDVQAHLHPHWLHASINEGVWSFPLHTFLLGNIASDPEECRLLARDLLLRCKDYLEALLQPVDAGYHCVAYRAGGYGLQPNDRAIVRALWEAGFRIDSSIVPDMRLISKVNGIDFRGTPREANYRMSGETGITRTAETGVFEIPIAAGRMTFAGYSRVLSAYLRERRRSASEEWSSLGRGVLRVGPDTVDPVRRMARSVARKISRLSRRWEMLELSDDAAMMFSLTKSYLGRFRAGNVYFSMISHAKAQSSAMLRALGEYHARMRSHYGSDFRALSFQSVADEIHGG